MQTVRVALFSPRLKPLLTTLISLNQAPKFRFIFDECADIADAAIDIAVLNLGDTKGRALLTQARGHKPNLHILYLARDDADVVPDKNVVAHKNLMAEFVPMLNNLGIALFSTTAEPETQTSNAASSEAVNIKSGGAARSQRNYLRALLIDSSPTMRAQLVDVVKSIGINSETAETGLEALKLLAGNAYNIIYVDLKLKDTDGYRLCRELKRNPTHRDTPVIMLANDTLTYDSAQAKIAGCFAAVSKPIDLKAFYATTVEALSQTMGNDDVSSLTRDPTVTLPVKR